MLHWAVGCSEVVSSASHLIPLAKALAGKERSAGSERLVHSPPARRRGRAHKSQLGNVVLSREALVSTTPPAVAIS